ncbi:hypothetical protein [Lutibacter sp.]|uniref:hypothetical protein n=1 Tax=Lutibacter sp. TaxID=1925666 RepID=UPI002733DDA1|nr:hypothetical protein [Lutibacter sp.]MDP3313600.1 hypothetical protein [Lutibacter sp.]
MSDKNSKILTIIVGIIGFIGIFFFFRIMAEGDEAITASLASGGSDSIVAPFITFSIILLAITIIIAVGYSMLNLAKHPDVLKRTMMGVGVLVVILVISYVLASDAAVTDAMGNVLPDGEAGSVSKWVSTGINYSAILGVIGFGAFASDFVKSLLK